MTKKKFGGHGKDSGRNEVLVGPSALNCLDCDFYAVEERDGEKYVHVWGYFYYADTEIVPGKPYRWVDYDWFIVPLADFAREYKEKYNEWAGQCRQGIVDLDRSECIDLLLKTKSGVLNLPYGDLTEDTPCGEYVDYAPKKAGK